MGSRYWKSLLALAIIHGVDVGLENFSIVYISISLNQIIKATVPAMTLVLSWLFEDRHYTTQMVLSTALTVVGAILAVLNNPQIKEDGVYGIVAACLSAVAGAVSTILLGLLLQRAKINAVTISFASSLPSALVLLPAFFAYEWPVLTDSSHFAHKYDDTHIWLAVVAVLACFYNLSRLYLIKFTAAHYSVVAGNVKVAVIVLLSMAVFGDHGGFSAQNWAGVVLTIIGFTVYTYLKFLGRTE
jgi:solute carrier family 35 protein C2